MKIAMFGGTFDPIHYGHIRLLKAFEDYLSLDRIYVVPTRIPPHKAAAVTDGEFRLEMCRLALGEPEAARIEASDIELRRDGLSWSFYTVSALLEQNPGADFYLIVGADMFMTMETWHRFDELKKLITVCTVPRDDDTPERLSAYAARLNSLGCRTVIMDHFDPVPISSTMIRRKIVAGESIDGLTPPSVAEFIKAHGLYRG